MRETDGTTLIRRGHLVRNLFSLEGGINSDRINVKSCSLKPSADTKINVELEATIKDHQILKHNRKVLKSAILYFQTVTDRGIRVFPR